MRVLCLILCCCINFKGFSQQTDIQFQYFSFMVIPYLNEGENIESKLKQTPDLRNAIAYIETTLIEKGFQVYDFQAQLNQLKLTENLKDNIGITKDKLLSFAAPDIYCEVDIRDETCYNNLHKARVTLKTYLTSSGRLLNNKTADCNCFKREADFLKLVKRTVNDFINPYVVQIEKKLNQFAVIGQPIAVNLVIDDNAVISFDDQVKGIINGKEEEGNFTTIIGYWLSEQPNVLFHKSSGNTSNLFRLPEIRISLINAKTKRLYNVEQFTGHFARFLRTLTFTDYPGIEGLEVKITRINGIIIIHLSH